MTEQNDNLTPAEPDTEAAPPRRSRTPLIAALALAVLGGGGWYLYSQGKLPGFGAKPAAKVPAAGATAATVVGEERLRVLAEVNGKTITAEEVAPALVNGLDRAVAVDRYVTRLLASEAAMDEYPDEAKVTKAAAEREVLANLYLRRKSEELVMAVTQADIDKFYKQQVRDEDYASYKLNYYLTQDDLDATAMERNIGANDAEAKGKFVPVNREGDGFLPLAATPYGLGALVARAKPGDYLRAVRVRDGFLILHVEQVRAGKKPPQTKDLNDQIRNLIAQDLLNKELLERRERAQVKLKL
jgi:parvulin-like peptidyl-prolyl isomerase